MPLGSRQNYRNPGEGRGPFFNIPRAGEWVPAFAGTAVVRSA